MAWKTHFNTTETMSDAPFCSHWIYVPSIFYAHDLSINFYFNWHIDNSLIFISRRNSYGLIEVGIWTIHIYGDTAWDLNGSPVEEKSVWMLYHSHHTYRASLQNETLKQHTNQFYEVKLWRTARNKTGVVSTESHGVLGPGMSRISWPLTSGGIVGQMSLWRP